MKPLILFYSAVIGTSQIKISQKSPKLTLMLDLQNLFDSLNLCNSDSQSLQSYLYVGRIKSNKILD